MSALPGFDSDSDKLIFYYFALGDVLKSLIQTTPLNEPFFTDFEAKFRPVLGFDDMTERYFDHPCSANAWERHQAFVESLSPDAKLAACILYADETTKNSIKGVTLRPCGSKL